MFFGKDNLGGYTEHLNEAKKAMENLIAPTYAADGVNVKEGDSFSEFAGKICRESYANSPFVTVRDWSSGRFRGPRTFRLKETLSPECELSGDPDGNGTKVILTSAADGPAQAAFDLFAMTGMDGVRYGGRNVVLLNQLDTSTLDKAGTPTNRFFCHLIRGLGYVAAKQKVVVLKGETAEMGPCVSSEDPQALAKFLWGGVMISIFHPNVFITGEGLGSGKIVMALREYGLRANGGSSAQKAFSMWYGPEWYQVPAARRDIAAAAVPSVLYENFLSDLNGWNTLVGGMPVPKLKIHAIAHITGGGIPSKFFEDILKPRGLSAKLPHLWEPPDIMQKFAEWRGVTGKETYEIWHGGQGALVVIDEEDVSRFVELADIAEIEAKPAGEVFATDNPHLIIHSKFDGSKLTWP